LEEKVNFGAFSTLLGVNFWSDKDNEFIGYFSSIAIGDSCLFRIRNNKLTFPFPIKRSEDFNNSPILLSSNLKRNSDVWKEVKIVKRAYIVSGDILILASDAISKWFLSKCERGEKPWNKLLEFTEIEEPDKSFEEWINELRGKGEMRNDDVTVIIVKLNIEKSE